MEEASDSAKVMVEDLKKHPWKLVYKTKDEDGQKKKRKWFFFF